MDIQEEREAFEAWYCRNHTGLKQSDLAKFRTLSGYSFSDSLKINISWEAWQAAKAQAVPEGFVVLKISDVREILSNASDAMDAESPSSVFTQTGIPSTWYDHHLVAEKNILDAIKAQEPTND
jgi:hypothetical protein